MSIFASTHYKLIFLWNSKQHIIFNSCDALSDKRCSQQLQTIANPSDEEVALEDTYNVRLLQLIHSCHVLLKFSLEGSAVCISATFWEAIELFKPHSLEVSINGLLWVLAVINSLKKQYALIQHKAQISVELILQYNIGLLCIEDHTNY